MANIVELSHIDQFSPKLLTRRGFALAKIRRSREPSAARSAPVVVVVAVVVAAVAAQSFNIEALKKAKRTKQQQACFISAISHMGSASPINLSKIRRKVYSVAQQWR